MAKIKNKLAYLLALVTPIFSSSIIAQEDDGASNPEEAAAEASGSLSAGAIAAAVAAAAAIAAVAGDGSSSDPTPVPTIPPTTQPPTTQPPTTDEARMPGDLFLERKIRSYIRWNALAMVLKANKSEDELGGHISTFSSAATLSLPLKK